MEELDLRKLIKWKTLSILITGNDNSIRANKCPKKHKELVNELIGMLLFFVKNNGLTMPNYKPKK